MLNSLPSHDFLTQVLKRKTVGRTLLEGSLAPTSRTSVISDFFMKKITSLKGRWGGTRRKSRQQQSRHPPAKQTVNFHHWSKTGKKEVAERASDQDRPGCGNDFKAVSDQKPPNRSIGKTLNVGRVGQRRRWIRNSPRLQENNADLIHLTALAIRVRSIIHPHPGLKPKKTFHFKPAVTIRHCHQKHTVMCQLVPDLKQDLFKSFVMKLLLIISRSNQYILV